jgi:Ca2+-binding EF-hand superfamily protein
LQQILAAQLSRLSDDSDQTANADATATSASGQGTSAGSNGDVTGSSTTQLSDGILGVLFQMQQQSTATTANGAADGTTATDASSPAAALKSFLASMDTNGDNQVSQSEFEAYLTKNGGTKEQADKIFGALDSDGSGGISSDELTAAVKNGRPHGHHGHHGHGGPGDIADDLLKSLDSDNDGTVSQTDLESFLTAKGGTKSQADSDFAALDINGDGALSKNEIAQKLVDLLQNPEGNAQNQNQQSAATTASASNSQSVQGDQSSAWLRMIDALANAPSSTATKTSTVAIAA